MRLEWGDGLRAAISTPEKLWTRSADGIIDVYDRQVKPMRETVAWAGRALLDPAPYLDTSDLVVVGNSATMSYATIEVRATPRALPFGTGFGKYVAQASDEVMLSVHAKRGVLLREDARITGQTYALSEFRDIAFDEEMPDKTFDFPDPWE
jgi:hypothetical protein